MSERIILSRSKGHKTDKSGNVRSEQTGKKRGNQKEKVKTYHEDF